MDGDSAIIETLRAELERSTPSRRKRILEAIALAALGSIPWVGGVLSAAATFNSNESSSRQDEIRTRWLEEHQSKFRDLRDTLNSMFSRIESLGEEINDRIESDSYLTLVRMTFRQWDQAETNEKRRLLVNLLTNAAGLRVCSDDILRLFLKWIDSYHETHFAVIRVIYKSPGPTRYDIWTSIYGEQIPRDDAPEADLFKMLIHDLSIGHVIRQAREVNDDGHFRKKGTPNRRIKTTTLESPFEDTKQYVLTGLGRQFVHYSMTELVTRLNANGPNEAAGNSSEPR